MDYVPIKPRYQDFDAPGVVSTQTASSSPAVPNHNTGPVQSAEPARGLFTSIYDNKIIVLIIVVIIIIIALLAYVVYRKDEPATPQPPKSKKKQQEPAAAEAPPAQVGAAEVRPAQVGAAEAVAQVDAAPAAPVNGSAQAASGKPSAEDLQKMLARGRAAAAPAPKEEPSQEFDDEIAESEILALMRDDEEQPKVEEELKTPTVDASVETPESIAASVQFPPPQFDPAYCATMVKNHQCKNRPAAGGKCRVHSK